MHRLAALCLLLACGCLASESHSEHDLDWAAHFYTPHRFYSLVLRKTNASYADDHLLAVMLPVVGTPNNETIGALEPLAHSYVHNTSACTSLEVGGTVEPAVGPDFPCFILELTTSWPVSVFRLDTGAHAGLALFLQHPPSEFINGPGDAFLLDADGAAVDYFELLDHDHDEEHHDDDDHDGHEDEVGSARPWGGAIGATFVVASVTLVGLAFLSPCISMMTKNYANLVEIVISGFAAGALISCAFLILLFESTHLIGTGWAAEVEVVWRWGACIMAGFISSAIMAFFAHLAIETSEPCRNSGRASSDVDELDVQKSADVEKAKANKPIATKEIEVSIATRSRIISGILLGDFMHNFCDGVFVGAAFISCGSAFGWSVAAASVAHEIAQEISDYLVLTSPSQGALRPLFALTLNFLCGLGAVLGAVVVLSAPTIDESTIGMLLAFGGGVYLHVGAAECMPKLYAVATDAKTMFISLFAFIVGAVAIGLVLLSHDHCQVDAHAHTETEHAH